MTTADVGGFSVRYEEKVNGDLVIFSRGIPTDYGAWGAQTEVFFRRRRMIALSRRAGSELDVLLTFTINGE